jgi:hypothetical protein
MGLMLQRKALRLLRLVNDLPVAQDDPARLDLEAEILDLLVMRHRVESDESPPSSRVFGPPSRFRQAS